jgi:hypothetical protein
MTLWVELYRPISNERGWLYTIGFFIDDLLTANEVRDKVLRAASMLREHTQQLDLDFRTPAEREYDEILYTQFRRVQ